MFVRGALLYDLYGTIYVSRLSGRTPTDPTFHVQVSVRDRVAGVGRSALRGRRAYILIIFKMVFYLPPGELKSIKASYTGSEERNVLSDVYL